MEDGIRRIALIPAYEPGTAMTETAAGLKRNGFTVVIVDDGSGGDYKEVFNEAEDYAYVIHYPENKGKGRALKTGFEYIKEKYAGPYTVVCVDADGQHKVEDVLKVCDFAECNRNGLTIGERRFSGKVPFRSRFGNSATRLVFRLSSGKKVYDTQTGLRAFSDRLLQKLLDIDGERYEYEMNMLMVLAKENIPIEGVGIETLYIDDNSSSHFNAIKDSYRIYKEILKFSGISLFCFGLDYLLYCVLLALSGIIVFANVAARLMSGTVNYLLNRKVVFKSKASVVRSAMQYIGLAIFILICNTLLLEALAGLGLNGYLAKIPVELVMSCVSWIVQHKLIFKPEECTKLKPAYAAEQKINECERKESVTMGRHKWAIIFSLCLAAFTVYISLDTFVLSSTYQTDATEMNLSMFEGLEGSEKTVLNDESGLEKGDSSKKPSMSKSIPRRSESESDSDTEGNSSKKPSGFSKMPYSGFGKSRKHSDSSTEEEKDKDPSGSTENSEKAELVADGKSGTYSDGNICITLKEYRYEDTSVYAADIKLTSAVYLKTAFAQDTYGKNITAKTSDIAEEKNAVLAINGDYYGAREKGCVIRNGVAYREAEGDDDILCIYADGSFKIASPKDVTAAELVEDGVWQAFSFGPALIEDGTITVSKGDEVGRAMASNPRTAIGVIDKLHYVFVVADGRTGESEGLTLSELANFMKELGATTAYNLDGGGSSSMVFEGEQINIPTTNGSSIKERSVSDIVYIG